MIQKLIDLHIKHVLLKDKPPEFHVAYNHYSELCKREGIKITHMPFNEKYRAQPGTKKIWVPFPTTLENISIIYHELGHVMHPRGGVVKRIGERPTMSQMMLLELIGDPYQIEYECNANLWAVRNAPITLDYEVLVASLQSYLENRDFIHRVPHRLLRRLKHIIDENNK